MKREDGFLDRWSRRKLRKPARVEEPPAEPPPESPESSAAPETGETPGKTDREILEELGLPDPDGLKPGDDFSGFMAKAVPRRLRNRALRKLWLTDPVLANLDELVDYGDDFTDAATVVENLQTAYRVGRGMLTSEEEDDRAEKAAETPEDNAQGDAGEDDAGDGARDGAPPEDPPSFPSAPETAAGDAARRAPEAMADGTDAFPTSSPPIPMPRRMRFTFDDA